MSQEHDDLYALIQEAHGAMKDLRALLRQAAGVKQDLIEAVRTEQTKMLDETATETIKDFTGQVMAAFMELDRTIEQRYQDVFKAVLNQEKTQPSLGETPEEAVLRIIRDRGV